MKSFYSINVFFWGETHFLCVIWNGGIRFNDEIEIFFCESFFSSFTKEE